MTTVEIKMVVDLTLARVEIIKSKYADQGYDWAMMGEEGRKLMDEALSEIDKLLAAIKTTVSPP